MRILSLMEDRDSVAGRVMVGAASALLAGAVIFSIQKAIKK